MYIVIEKEEDITNDFIRWLLNRIYLNGLAELSVGKQRLQRFDDFFDEMFKGPRKIRAYDVIVSGFKNMSSWQTGGKIYIGLNPKVKVPLTQTIPLYAVCQLIDKGNMELQPYPIFTKVLQEVQINLFSYLQ